MLIGASCRRPLCRWRRGGHNNRTVVLRMPCSDKNNHRVEYRVAGADANPCLFVSTILADILYGLDTQLRLLPSVQGNGHEAEGLALPIRQSNTLYEFERSYPQAAGRAFQPRVE